jgi:hypothetical protein
MCRSNGTKKLAVRKVTTGDKQKVQDDVLKLLIKILASALFVQANCARRSRAHAR